MCETRRTVVLTAVLLAGGTACGRTPAPGAGAGASEVRSAGPSAAPGDRPFAPPADGRLTAAQVESYIAVRRRALDLARGEAAGSAPRQLAEVAAAERRAARELGRDVSEYLWVAARVAEERHVDARELQGLAGTIEAAARSGREQILGRGPQSAPTPPAQAGPDAAALADNRALLERYRSEIDGISSLPATPPGPAPAPRS